jgi:hypothetical protein
MRIVIGVFLGTGLFLVGSILYLFVYMWPMGAKAIGLSAIEGLTIQNPLYWLAFAVMIGVGCRIVRGRRQA